MKIGLRFFTRRLFHFSADTNLPVQLDPVKAKCSLRIRLKLLPLGAFVIRKEHEAVLIETLEQDDSHRWSAVATGGSEAHRIDVADASLNRGREPIPKLFNRIGMKIAPAQTFPDMLVT